MDDGRTDRQTDGRTTEPAYTISSPGFFGSGELIKAILLYVDLLAFLPYIGYVVHCSMHCVGPE